MRRLLLAEFDRLRSRRLTWVALLLVAVVLAGLQVIVYFTVRPLSAAELAQGQSQFQQAQRQYAADKTQHRKDQDCIAQGSPPEECSSAPRLNDFLPRTPVPYHTLGSVLVPITVFLTGLAALFLSASVVGAEYSSGGLGNWLTFFPQRGRVFASKLLSLVVAAALASAVASAVTIGVAALIATLVGAAVSGVGALAETAGRGVVVVAIFTVLGFALALVTRHTIAAAGTLVGYLFASFVFTLLSGALPGLQKLARWRPEVNLLAFLRHGYTYTTTVAVTSVQGQDFSDVPHLLSFGHSAVYWAVVVVAAVAGSLWVFRRRDVT